jgi:hypothetical protein
MKAVSMSSLEDRRRSLYSQSPPSGDLALVIAWSIGGLLLSLVAALLLPLGPTMLPGLTS